jgi:hypothetical protein
MVKIFDRNMFIMLFSIMLGVVIITYFSADILRRTEIEGYQEQIQTITTEKQIIEDMSKNLTDNFFKSIGSLDFSREYRAEGNTYFDFASKLWYPQEEYLKVMDNCTQAMQSYLLAYENFLKTKSFFNDTMAFTYEAKYISIFGLYMDLSASGARLSMLRYNASKYLYDIAENKSLYGEDVNITELFELFNLTGFQYDLELQNYTGIMDDIGDVYGKFFNPIRETP